jgi:flagellar hook protein FlgE
MNSAFSAGVQGLNNASSSMSDSASNIARAQTERDNGELIGQQTSVLANELSTQFSPQRSTQSAPVNLTNELINLRVEQFNAQSSIHTIQTADEVLGTLIDVRV